MSSDPFQWQSPQGQYPQSEYSSTMSTMQHAGSGGDPQHDLSAGEPSSSSRSPLSRLGLGFLEGLGPEKKTNRDGQQPKKRGPKPDSKPALTRRQQLNRQAQRTHRERKEGYIKSLEEQTMQLREVYKESLQEKNAIADENRRLKDLLRMHGIVYSSRDQSSTPGYVSESTVPASSRSASAYGYAQSRRLSPSQTHPSLSGSPSFAGSDFYGERPALPTQQSMASQQAIGSVMQGQHLQPQMQPQTQQGDPLIDYDEIGVNFVLESVPQQSSDMGHTSPPPPHHLPSQDFPPYNARPR